MAIKSNHPRASNKGSISSMSIKCMVKGPGSRGCIPQQGCARGYLEGMKTGLGLWQSSRARVVGHGCGMVLHGLKGLGLRFSLARGERRLWKDSCVGLWV